MHGNASKHGEQREEQRPEMPGKKRHHSGLNRNKRRKMNAACQSVQVLLSRATGGERDERLNKKAKGQQCESGKQEQKRKHKSKGWDRKAERVAGGKTKRDESQTTKMEG